jgi:hypothetical protein
VTPISGVNLAYFIFIFNQVVCIHFIYWDKLMEAVESKLFLNENQHDVG